MVVRYRRQTHGDGSHVGRRRELCEVEARSPRTGRPVRTRSLAGGGRAGRPARPLVVRRVHRERPGCGAGRSRDRDGLLAPMAARCFRARSLRPRAQVYSPAIGRRPCLRKSSLRASPSRDWTVRPWVAPSMLSWRWTAGEKWPAILTLPGPRFLESRRGSGRFGFFECPRARDRCFCIRHSDLPGSRADRLVARVLLRRRPRAVSARACLPAGLSERSCALPPSDCRVYPGFARLAIGVVGAACPRCHDCCGLLACHALETLLGRGLVSDWDDLSATEAGTVASAAWGRSPVRLRPWPWRGWDVERGGVRRPRVLASRMPRA